MSYTDIKEKFLRESNVNITKLEDVELNIIESHLRTLEYSELKTEILFLIDNFSDEYGGFKTNYQLKLILSEYSELLMEILLEEKENF